MSINLSKKRTGTHSLLSLMVIMLTISLFPENAGAKIKVVTPAITSNPKRGTLEKSSRLKQFKPSSGKRLEADGFPVLITKDANGNTQVYVKDDNTADNIRQEKYRVELSANEKWTSICIYAGGSGKDANVTMDGGEIGKLIMGAHSSSDETRNCTLNITGGSVQYISVSGGYGAAVTGDVNISLSGMTYTGSQPINAYSEDVYNQGTQEWGKRQDNIHIFVNPNCKFDYDYSEPIDEDIVNMAGAIIPKQDGYDTGIYCRGTGTVIPSGHTVNVSFIEMAAGVSVVNNGSINVSSCTGMSSNLGTISGTAPVVAEHKLKEVCDTKEDCENSGTYHQVCTMCNQQIGNSYTKEALGHTEVDDPDAMAVDPTCLSIGHTQGTHCSVCGVKMKAQEDIAMLQHIFSEWETVSNSTCVAPGTKKHTCTREGCGFSETEETALSANHQFAEDGWAVLKEATCLDYGTEVRSCSLCGEATQSRSIAPKGHSFTYYTRIDPTCETDGRFAYEECNDCHQRMKRNKPNGPFYPIDYDDALLVNPAIGHDFSEQSTSVEGAFISAATCEKPAYYHKSCSHCQAVSTEESDVFASGEPLGHIYSIQSIDSLSPEYAGAGYLTLACKREKCNKHWENFWFDYFGAAGIFVEDMPFNGYYYYSRLMKTTKTPTCLPGEGIYNLTINYKGQMLYAEFTHFIPPVEGVHNWSAEDGICHENHYVMQRDEYGDVVKDYAGNIQFVYEKNADGTTKLDENGDSILVIDNTEYRAKTYLQIASDEYYLDENGDYVYDDNDERLTYQDWNVTTYDNANDAFHDATSTSNEAVLGLFEDVTFDEYVSFNNYNGLTIELNGHTLDGSHYDEDSNSTTYTQINISNDMTIKNGTLLATPGNWGDNKVLTLDNVTAHSDYVSWGEVGKGTIVVKNNSHFTNKGTYVNDIDLDNTSSITLHDVDVFHQSILHYLPEGYTYYNNFIHDADDNLIDLRTQSLTFYGTNRSEHTLGYIDKGYGYHAQGCTICGITTDGSLEEHTLDENGSCTLCPHNADGWVDTRHGTHVHGCNNCREMADEEHAGTQINHTLDENNICTVCLAEFYRRVSFVDGDGETRYAESANEATRLLRDENGNAILSEITLLEDVDNESLYYDNCFINLNNHTIVGTYYSPVIRKYHKTIIKGEGNVIANEGYFAIDLSDNDPDSNIQLMGGTYSSIGIDDYHYNGNGHFISKDILAPGYILCDADGNAITDYAENHDLEVGKLHHYFYPRVLENVTVRLCDHGNTTPGEECELCGLTAPMEIAIDDNDTYTRNEEMENVNVTYTRTFSESLAGKWQALFVPFSIDVTSEVLDQCDIAQLYMISLAGSTNGMVEGNDAPNVAVILKFQQGDTTPAATPLFIRPKSGGEFTINQSSTTLLAADNVNTVECSTTQHSYVLRGSYSGITLDQDTDDAYYSMKGGSVTLTTGSVSHPNRWFLTQSAKRPNGNNPSQANIRLLVMDEDASAIQEVLSDNIVTDTRVFTLDGRQVNPQRTPLTRGFYIRGGKKYIVR